MLLRVAASPIDDSVCELTGADILNHAQGLADEQGIRDQRRAIALLLLPHSRELFATHLGLVSCGHLPAILPWPTNRIDPEKYQRNLLHQLRELPADFLITIPQLAANLGPGLPYRVISCPVQGGDAYERTFARAFRAEPVATRVRRAVKQPAEVDGEAVFLQFSGGTTGTQKCVVVTEAMLVEQLERLRETLDVGAEDRVVSWLPMYHDMGLIACLWFPLWCGVPSFHFAASDWLLRPEKLFGYIERYRATFCWLPNFAFAYLAQRRASIERRYDLSSVRGWINCSEPVRLRSMMAFLEAFADYGVAGDSLQASYAMAESVFAVTQTTLGQMLPVVRRSAVRTGGRQYKELAFDVIEDVYVSSGKPLRDTHVRVVNSSGAPVKEREAGEIEIATPSLFQGYWGREGFRTSAFTEDGWYATGDYGFLSDGELYVVGRIKDIVIVGGQNIFPEDVETLASTVNGVYAGRVVAFGVEDEELGTQNLALVAEMRGEYDAPRGAEIESEIRQLILAAIGVAPRHVAVVPERWIVKSTAGKISRRETRERFVTERIHGVASRI